MVIIGVKCAEKEVTLLGILSELILFWNDITDNYRILHKKSLTKKNNYFIIVELITRRVP